MTAPRFTARPYMWEHNQEVSRTINAARVNVTDDAGQLHDGVGIFSLGRPRQMLTPDAARRLALDIVNALESIQTDPGPDHLNR